MTIHQKIASVFVTLSFVALGFFPDRVSSAVAVVSAILLYGVLVFIDQKADGKSEAQGKRISELEEKMNSLMMGRAMGR